jgi:flagellar hook-associated protein 2
MPITSTGLVSGINVDSILAQIQAAEQKPILQLQSRQTGYQNQISAMLSLSGKLSTFAAVTTSVNTPANFNTLIADVTKNPSGVSLLTASAASNATTGSYAITVLQLAQASKKASQGFVDQNTTAIASAAGTFKFKVGSAGTEHSVTVSASTTLQGLRDAINSVAGSATASIVNDGTGSNPYRLVLTANTSGATNAISITNNDTSLDFTNKKVEAAYALTTNGFSGTVSSNAGDNYTGTTSKTFLVKIVTGGAAGAATYKYSIDGGINYVGANGAAYSGANAITTQGALTNYIDSAVASNSTNEGVKVAFGAGTLVADDTFTVDVFNPAFQTAQDAVVKIDNTTITKSSNVITDAIQGVTLNLAQVDAANAVTLNVSSSSTGLTDKIKNFVSAYNDVNKFLTDQFTFDPKVKKAGALLADASVRAVQRLLKDIVSGSIPGLTSGKTNLSQIGITSHSTTGTLAVDEGKLGAAITADPEGVKRLFVGLGKPTNSAISFVGLGSKTVAGTYGVQINTAPAKATVGGTGNSNFQDLSTTGLTSAEQLSFTFSSNNTATSPSILSFGVTLTAASKINDVVSALNSAFTTNKVGLSASNDSGRLKITSTDYGKDIRFTVVSDQAGTTQTGIGTGGAAASVSRSFNGSSDYLRVEDSASLDITAGLTVAFWAKFTSIPGAGTTRSLVAKTEGGSYGIIANESDSGRIETYFYQVGFGYVRAGESLSNLSAGQWYHFAGTFDGTDTKFYRDGVLKETITRVGTLSTTGQPLLIGANPGTPIVQYMNGSMDDVQIFNRGLLSSEVTQIKNDPTSVTSGLAGLWRITGASPEADGSGNNNNATVNGTTTGDGHAAASAGSGVVGEGVDVAGTINGHAATGKGSVLTSHSGFAEEGLSISTETTTTGLFGTIAVSRGVADRLVTGLANYTDPTSGIFIGKTNTLQATVDRISDTITKITDRIAQEGDRLRGQFVRLETLLGQFQATSNFLTNQLSKLPTFSSTRSSPGGILPS